MIKTIYMIFFVCAFSLGLWACAGKQKAAYKDLNSAQFEELIKNENVQLLDVRTLAEYMEGHIPGSPKSFIPISSRASRIKAVSISSP